MYVCVSAVLCFTLLYSLYWVLIFPTRALALPVAAVPFELVMCSAYGKKAASLCVSEFAACRCSVCLLY
jgi:hypothetical protein